MNETTIFEKIIAGEIPCNKVYEDEKTLAFLDISPKTPGHTLVIPKVHTENIYEMTDEDASAVILTVKKVAVAIKKSLSAAGIKIVMNNEPAGGQVVFHPHFHIIPVSEEGYPKGHHTYSEGEADEIVEKIQAEL